MTNQIDNATTNTPSGQTGPRTPEGKFESSKNAFSHGLTASTIDRFPEHIREAYAKFLAEQYQEHRPCTTNERDFLEQFAFNRFQISRAQSMISEAWEKLAANPGDEVLEKKYQKLNRHIKALERSARYALAELRTFISDRIRSSELQFNFPNYIQDDVGIPIAYPVHKLLSPQPKKEEIQAAARAYIEDLATRFPAEMLIKPEHIEKAKQHKAADEAATQRQAEIDAQDRLDFENFKL